MGLFSSKTRVKVQSTVLNLAGDIGNRPNFMKTIIFDQTMHKMHPTYSEAITSAYLNGQGIKLRRVVPYAKRTNYFDLIGQNKATINVSGSINVSDLTDVLNYYLVKDLRVIEAEIDFGNIFWWAEQWLMENHPTMVSLEYDAIFNEDTDDIDIIFTKSGNTLSFTPTNFDYRSQYLFVEYNEKGTSTTPLFIPGNEEEVTTFPDMGTYTLVSSTQTSGVFTWVDRVNVSHLFTEGRFYEDPEVATQHEETHPVEITHYTKTVDVLDGNGDPKTIQYDAYHTTTKKLVLTESEEVVVNGNETITTKSAIYTLEDVMTTKVDALSTLVVGSGPRSIYIYRRGDGNAALDAFFATTRDGGEYLPFIPVKTDTNPGKKARQTYIDSNTFPDLYKANVSMMRKVSGKNSYDGILSNLQDNEGSSDINYAYVIFGVAINTPDIAAKSYIYKYFKSIITAGGNNSAFTSYAEEWALAETSVVNWNKWFLAQGDRDDPLFGITEPGVIPYPSAPITKVNLTSNNKLNLNYSVSWSGVKLRTGTGRATATIKTNYSEIVKGEKSNLVFTGVLGGLAGGIVGGMGDRFNSRGDEIIIYHQLTQDTWEAIHVYGLSSNNMIYGGKGVFHDAYSELSNNDESSLIIPLNNAMFKSMPLIAATQMTTGCMYMMINTYQTWDKKYYETDWFKVIIIVIVVVLSVFSGGAAAPLSGTIGGGAASAIGLTGLASIVFAMAVNAIVGIIVTRIITAAATAIFGDKIGIIIGAIASMVAMNGISAMSSGQQFNIMDAFNSQNLIKLSTTIANDFGELYAKETAKIMKDTQQLMEDYKTEADKIRDAYGQEFGNRASIDSLGFLKPPKDLYFEASDAFLFRTLMTGSDIAELSMESISMLTDIGTMLEV